MARKAIVLLAAYSPVERAQTLTNTREKLRLSRVNQGDSGTEAVKNPTAESFCNRISQLGVYNPKNLDILCAHNAGIDQLVEQLTCNL
jgi:hypothetical protein